MTKSSVEIAAENYKKTCFSWPTLSLVLCTAVSFFASPILAEAQEWRIEPIFKAGLVADDNGNLSTRTDRELELNGSLLEARADIYYASESTAFFVQPRVLVRTYSGESDFNSDEFYLRSSFRKNGESNTFGFRVNFDQQSVRTGERSDSNLDIDDPDEIPNDDTGLVGLDGDRFRMRLSPFWDYRLSNISSIGIAADYFDTQYDAILAGQLIDYTDSRINLNYRRFLSTKTTGVLTLTGRRFQPDGLLSDNTGFGILAGFEHALTQKTRLTARIGVENTDTTSGQSSSEIIGNITLLRDLETISLFARYQRAVTANGAGTVEVRDTVNMNFERRLHDKISAGLGVRAYQAERIDSSSSIADRKHVQLQAKFIWYLSKAFIVETDYRYTILDRSNAIGERSNANEIGIWLVYQPNTVPKL